jgi:hypothetical protein
MRRYPERLAPDMTLTVRTDRVVPGVREAVERKDRDPSAEIDPVKVRLEKLEKRNC